MRCRSWSSHHDPYQGNGPAAKAGVQAGDVVIRVNGDDINYSADLPAQIALLKPGTNVRLDMVRNGKQIAVDVSLGAMKDRSVAVAKNDSHARDKLGVLVRPLAKGEQREAGVPSGLLVEQAMGRAARAGIEAGDVIVSVNGVPAVSVEQLQQIISKTGKAGSTLALLVQRESARIFVPIDLG